MRLRRNINWELIITVYLVAFWAMVAWWLL